MRYGAGWSGVSRIETALMISLLGWMSGGESGAQGDRDRERDAGRHIVSSRRVHPQYAARCTIHGG